MKLRLCWIGIAMAFVAIIAEADVPGLINYQAYLTDPDGYPIGDVLDMQFTLWDDPTDTDPSHLKWTETWDTVTEQVEVSDGYYSVLLGSYTSFGPVFEDNGALWLQVEVDAEVMTSRKRIAAVAYALSAKSADELTFLITESHIEDGAVTVSKIATGAITGDKIAAGAVGSSQIADGTILESDLGFSVVTVETDPTVPTNLKDGVDFSELSGTATDEQIPNNVTIDFATAAGTASAAPWSGITAMPTGFSDGTDDEGTADYGTEITYVPYTISSSGNYYLTGNLTGTGTTAITISADNVTIDLNGFTLQGTSGANDEYGIYITGERAEIRNGTVSGFGGTGIRTTSQAHGARLLDLRVADGAFDGIMLNGKHHIVRGCTLTGNGYYGINCNGNTSVTGCISSGNGQTGIYVNNGGTVTDCTVVDNGTFGIRGLSGLTITNNTARNNGSSGIHVSGTSIIRGNAATGNQWNGICAVERSTLADNAAYDNNQSAGDYLDICECADCTFDVRIGTPILYVPFTISEPGFYYFVRDLHQAAANEKGITVTADNVTIDLNGFTLLGGGGNYSTGNGIHMNGRNNVEIRNGSIRGFGNAGIYENNGSNHRVIGIRSNNEYEGGIILKGKGHLVKDCRAWGGFSNAILVGNYSMVIGNITSSITHDSGIKAGNYCSVTGNISYNCYNGISAGEGTTVIGNTCYNNLYGIIASQYCTIRENTVSHSALYGIAIVSESLLDQNTVNFSNEYDLGYTNFEDCPTCTWGTNHDGPLGP